jgi:hypothetical protein
MTVDIPVHDRGGGGGVKLYGGLLLTHDRSRIVRTASDFLPLSILIAEYTEGGNLAQFFGHGKCFGS